MRLREPRDTSILSDVELRRDLPKAKTPHEREIVKRQIAATDRQIGALMYGLYGLTEEGIRIAGQQRGDSRNYTEIVPDYPDYSLPEGPGAP